MCGIIGYAGSRVAAPILLDSLRRLEYRGYDSAGIAVLSDDKNSNPVVIKSDSKVDALVKQIESQGLPKGTVGIGHTRWATHGRPTVVNAHPHQDCSGKIHLIHNGIIENYRELREELISQGHKFVSDTDTEVVPHLIEEFYQGDLAVALRQVLPRIRGTYALVIISADEPDSIVGARLNAPLVVGLGDNEIFISSDITALIPYTKRVMLLGEGEIACVKDGKVQLTQVDGTEVEPKIINVDWEAEQAQKAGYSHFMLKEIHEQPEALRNALRGRIGEDYGLNSTALGIDQINWADVSNITIVACGTAGFAGLVVKYAMEKLARIRVYVETASEFRYMVPPLDKSTLVIAISQSGETADTLAAVQEARSQGVKVIAITNVVGSAITQNVDGVCYLQAGPEIGVAATKTFMAQVVSGILLALHVGVSNRSLSTDEQQRLAKELLTIPDIMQHLIGTIEKDIANIARRYAGIRSALYIGRGINFPIALEGALKLKEISYIHAEGYAAGEMKHGAIALLDADVPVVAIATEASTLAKTVSNIEEARVREAPVIALISEGNNPFHKEALADVIEVPKCEELFSPLVNIIPLQLLAYYIAVERGCDVDQPRNLAKSVTVE